MRIRMYGGVGGEEPRGSPIPVFAARHAGLELLAMPKQGDEHLPYTGEAPQSRLAYQRFLADVARGKSTLQLQAVAQQLTPDLRRAWLPQSFTGVVLPSGRFDAVVCNVSYHFHKHGQKYGNIRLFTEAARRYFQQNHTRSAPDGGGLYRLPHGVFDRYGRIVTFYGC